MGIPVPPDEAPQALSSRSRPGAPESANAAALHAARVAWGKKWGKLVSESVKQSIGGTG